MKSHNRDAVPVQFLITSKEGTFFDSNDSIGEFIPMKKKKIILDENKNGRKTTKNKP